MITSSAGSPGFIPLAPKRLKPKTSLSAQTSPAKQERIVESSPSPPGAARQIESLLNSRSRLHLSYNRNTAPLLGGIGEDDWSKFSEDFLANFCAEGAPTNDQSKRPISITRDDGVHSFYAVGSSGSSSNTVQLSTEETMLPKTPSSPRLSARNFLRRRPPSYPSGGSSTRRDSYDQPPGSPTSSLASIKSSKLSRCEDHRASSGSVSIRDIYVAVIGASGVGKSTFILRAYDLPTSPRTGELAVLNMNIEGVKCNVKLVEVNWNRIDFTQSPPAWPRIVDVPFIDGVCILYDVTNPSSFTRVPDTVDALFKSSTPVCIVSTKCDSNSRKVNPHDIENLGHVEHLQTSVTAQDSQKQTVAAILSLISRKNDNPDRFLHGRPRANSSHLRATSPRPSTSGHARASSEFSSSFLKDGFDSSSIHSAHSHRIPRSTGSTLGTLAINSSSPSLPSSRSSSSRKTRFPGTAVPYLEFVSSGPFSMHTQFGDSSNSSVPSWGSSDRKRMSYASTDDDSLGYYDAEEVPVLDRDSEDIQSIDEKQPIQGWKLDELVGRLLGPQITKADREFAATFLLLYRRFATPNQLLREITDRFAKAEVDEQEPLNRLEAQVRYCLILHHWVVMYPGDCAGLVVRKKLVSFLTRMEQQRALTMLAAEIFDSIDKDIPDGESDWAQKDMEELEETAQGSATPVATQPGVNMENGALQNLTLPRSIIDPSRRVSEVSSGISVTSSSSSQDFVNLKAGSNASLPTKGPITSQYDAFMNLTVQEVADELTRIDWLDFCRISSRDIIRHQSLSPEARERAFNLEAMNSLTKRFNHVAYWVATLILERTKPKHRARVLEKFMEIAWTLRHMNNYNSLGAVVAGISGTAINRLTQTHELVRPEIRKKFMRLELLMGTHKGHTKYRLAWENTSSERIPFIPVLRRDLASADEGNRTFLEDGTINWNKFQVMGDILENVARAQEKPYTNLTANPLIRKMMEETAVTANEDDLYERSVSLESSSSAPQGRSRRNWFARQP